MTEMTLEDAKLTLCANVMVACERAGFAIPTCKMVEDALDVVCRHTDETKLLTLKEVVNLKYPEDVYCEIKGEDRIFAVTAPIPARWIGQPDIRYWTERPTEVVRKAVPWQER